MIFNVNVSPNRINNNNAVIVCIFPIKASTLKKNCDISKLYPVKNQFSQDPFMTTRSLNNILI